MMIISFNHMSKISVAFLALNIIRYQTPESFTTQFIIHLWPTSLAELVKILTLFLTVQTL